MARIAIIFGILMIVLGIGLYAAALTKGVSTADTEISPPQRHAALRALTALIPAAFGLVLVMLGMIARKGSDKTRMHTMHAAALVGLLGVGLPGWRVVKALTAEEAPNWLAVNGNIAMAALSGVFLGLCIKSFIDVRRARQQREAQEPAT